MTCSRSSWRQSLGDSGTGGPSGVSALLGAGAGLLLSQSVSVSAGPPAGTYVIDKPHTSVTFRVSHMGFSRYTARFASVDGRLTVADSGTKLGACLAGFGVAQVIDLGLEHHFNTGALINLFPDWSDERFPLYVYYPSRNHVPAKVRALVDFLRQPAGG